MVTISPQSMRGNGLDAEAPCPVNGCKFTARVKSKKSETSAIKALAKKLQDHTSKCPKK